MVSHISVADRMPRWKRYCRYCHVRELEQLIFAVAFEHRVIRSGGKTKERAARTLQSQMARHFTQNRSSNRSDKLMFTSDKQCDGDAPLFAIGSGMDR